MQKTDHSGHRDRLREKYLNFGIEALAPHEVIELLLFYAVPYRNTNDIAKNLYDRFGSLSAVLDASMDMLTEAGLTRNQATFLKLIPDVTRRYMIDKHDNPSKIVDLADVPARLVDLYIGTDHEERVYIIVVDEKMKEVYSGVLAKGKFNAGEISIRRIMNLVLNYGAAGVVLAHNHPSGVAMPSQEDYYATDRIRKSLRLIGVELLDHFIVADHMVVSMRDSDMFD